MARIINFFGGPGCGKSTLAAGLFYKLKLEGHSVEFVTEFAKDLTWASRGQALSNQYYVFAKQLNRLLVVNNKVDIIITDSPLLLTNIYHNPSSAQYSTRFKYVVEDVFYSFNNTDNFLVTSDYRRYDTNGRSQTVAQSQQIGERIDEYLRMLSIPYREVTRETPIQEIYDSISCLV